MDNLGHGGGGGSNDAAYQFRVKDRSGNTSEEVNGGVDHSGFDPPGKNSVSLSSDNSKTIFEENQLAEMGITSPWPSVLMSLSNFQRSS